MTPRTITGAHRIYVLPKERNKSEYVDYCAQSTTLVEALTKDSLVEHLIIKCSDPWGFVFPDQLVSQKEREKPLRITLLLTEHIDHVRGNLPRWEELIARARTEGKLKGQVYRSGWQDCVVPRGVYVPSGLMTRIACRDKDASNFPDPTGGGKQEDGFTYRFLTDASLAKGSTAEELAQIRAYFGVDLSHSFKPIRKIKNGAVTNTQADMWVYEFLYARQMMEAHGASSGVYMNMLYWLNASEANITDFWEVAETTEDTAREIKGKLDKPKNGSYVLDIDIPSKFEELVKIGGRNLLKDSKNTFSNGNYFVGRYYIADQSQMVAGEEYTIQIWGTIDGRYFSEDLWVYNTGGNTNVASIPKITNGVWKQTFKWRDDADKSNSYLNLFRAANHPNNNKSFNTTITKIKLERGNVATDWTPAPEDILANLDTINTTLTSDIGSARKRADNAYGLAKHVNDVARKLRTDVNNLQPNVPTKDQKDWLDKMGKVLKPDSKVSGKTYHINGVNIDHSVFLRFSDGKPSALIGGQIGKGAVLMAGVQDYGTTNQRASTEIYQDGSAKFGAVKMLYNGMLVENDFMQMAFDKTAVQEPLLISDTQPKFVESLALSNVENRNVVSGANVYLTNNTRTRQYNFSTSNPSTKMTITIERVRCEVYPRNCALELLVDGVQIMSWRGDISYEQVDGSDFAGGGTKLNIQKTPSEETNITIERTLSKGNHTLLLRNSSTDSTDKGTFYGLKCNLYYDASKGSTILSASGFRAYTNNSRYFDIDRREKYYPPDASGGGGDDDLIPAEGMPNPYIARIRGGILLDRLDLEQPLDAPGCVLAGGRVENGYVRASFGKYKNQRGDVKPNAVFNNSTKVYTVYHSIGNTNYTPIVTSCAGAWGDVPQVVDVSAYSFSIKYINYNNEPSVGWNFNYVCYKGD